MTDTSESFNGRDRINKTALSAAEDRMQTFCKQMLKTRTFLGHYQENRFVQSLNAYRSIVVVSTTDEGIIKDFGIVKQRIKSFYQKPDFWVGYTDSDLIGVPHGACIWTEIEGLALGEYWFQIKTIRFRNNEAVIKLKMLKPLSDVEETIKQEQKAREKDSNYDPEQMAKNFQGLVAMWRKSSAEYFLWLFSQQITAKNMIQVLKFIFLVLFATATASVHGLMYLGEFTLKLLEEFRKLMHVMTPIILKTFDLVSKVIGGFFILIAMIWKDVVGRNNSPAYGVPGQRMPLPNAPTFRAIEYRPSQRNRGYSDFSSYRR